MTIGFIPLSPDECFAMGLLKGLRQVNPLALISDSAYLCIWSDNSTPIGPCLVAASAIPDPQTLSLKTVVNGEVLQDGTTA